MEDGTLVNLVPLETLHSLPKPGDIVLLPGMGTHGPGDLAPSAYRVSRVEHISARVEGVRAQSGQARLVKAVAHVEVLRHDLPGRGAPDPASRPLLEAVGQFASE